MAEAVVGFLLGNLTTLLSQETNLLLGVESEVKSLHAELKLTFSYLRSFDGNRYQQDTEKEFVSQIRDLAQEAEDIIDTYVANVVQQRGENIFEKARIWLLRLTSRRGVAENISDIKRRFKETYENRERFGIPITPTGASGRELPIEDDFSKRRRNFIEETDVVGLNFEADLIVNRLLRGGGYQRDVVPIVGMGGIGKTTLARKVYNNPIITENFNFRAWVYVSQDYNPVKLLLDIFKSGMVITDEIKEMNVEELVLELRKILRGTRYLIVLDDVWKTDCWEDLKHFLGNNMNKSRIILTTRINEVAFNVTPSNPPHSMKFLSNEECWELLGKKVFPDGTCPPELVKVGEQIAGKCGGLPLAVVVLAGVLLKKEKTVRWWSKVAKSVSSFLADPKYQCSEILALSYNNLPHYLRPCFLYFGLFPEDFEISAKHLIKLWVAEGFIQEKDGKLLEDVAEDNLDDLIDRNLIQIALRRFDGGVKTCLIHDLLRDLCIAKAKPDKFLEVCGHKYSSAFYESRRLGIHSSNALRYVLSAPASNLRSLLSLDCDEGKLLGKHWKSLYKRFVLLRVLDLWGVEVDTIPNEIGKLICLRYLRLKSHTARILPPSIYQLWNLETLEVAAPSIERPQITIWKMRELRHLSFNGQIVLPEPPKKLAKVHDRNGLTNLQSLSSLSPDSCTEGVLSELLNLVKLGICGDLEKHKDLAFKNISRLSCLHTLKLIRDRQYEKIDSLPDWAEFPLKLTKITLSETNLSVDPMKKLGQLPNLQVLKMTNGAYTGSELTCPSNGFPQLQVLKLINLGIKVWHISPGSMPCLRSVLINRCGDLVSLPTSMLQMSSFRELELWWPNVSVVKCGREIEKSRGREHFKLSIYHSDIKDHGME